MSIAQCNINVNTFTKYCVFYFKILNSRGICGASKKDRIGVPALSRVRQLYSPAASYIHFVCDIAFGSDMRYARLK